MVVLCEHLHIILMAGEAEDMRPGGSLNTTDVGIHPGFDRPALKKEYRLRAKVGCRIPILQTLNESLNSQDPWIIPHANNKGRKHLVNILMSVSHRQEEMVIDRKTLLNTSQWQ